LIIKVKNINKGRWSVQIVDTIIRNVEMWCKFNEKVMLFFPSKTQNLCCEGLLNLLIGLEATVNDLTQLALSR